MSASASVAFVALAAASLLLLALVARDVARSRRPARLLAAGRLAEARAAAGALATSWMRVVPGVGDAARYTIALTLHLDGALDASLEALAPLVSRARAGALDADLRYAVLSLDAVTLVLVDREPARAADEIALARALASHPEDALVEAHALLSLGRAHDADARAALVRPGTRAPPPRSPRLRAPAHRRVIEEAALHYLRGAYLVRRGRADDARAELHAAVASPRAGVYAARAAALLAGLAGGEGEAPSPTEGDAEGPSSLAPQILSAKPSRPPRA